MSEKTQIELVKVKSWFIPADATSYKILRQLGLPLTKIHRDSVPLMKLATEPRGIKAHARNFSELLEKRLDQMGQAWKSKPGRTCKLTETRLSFTAPASDKNRRDVIFIDTSFSKFCQRWGFKYVAEYSERDDKIRLVVDYSFDPGRNPVIDLAEQVKTPTVFELALGFTKIKIDFLSSPSTLIGGKRLAQALPPVIKVDILTQKGSEWETVHTGTCVDQQIGDLSQFMAAVAQMYERRALFDTGKEPVPLVVPKPPIRKEVIEQLKELTKLTETQVLDLGTCMNQEQALVMARALAQTARRIPRINAKLVEVGIDLVITRQMLVQHIDGEHAAWMHLFQQKTGQTGDQLESSAKWAWEHVKAVRDAWLKVEEQDVEGAVRELAKLAPIPGAE